MSDWYPGGAEWDECKPEEITLCKNCWCMTHTSDGKCAKCGEVKNENKSH